MPDLTEIEQDVARDRDALRSQIHALGGQLRPNRLVETATAQITQSGTVGALGPILKSSTMPLAVTGLGLSWLAAKLATRSSAAPPKVAYDTASHPTATGFRTPEPDGPDMAEFDTRIRQADAATPGRFGTETYQGETEMTYSDAHTPTLRERAYASADALRHGIEDGLDNLPDAARVRIRGAREAAINAHSQAEYHARRTAAAARQTAHDNPLLIGALAFVAGAALAAALPRSSVENRAIGAHRDRLFDEADRIFREEVEKAKTVAKEAVARGQEQVKETIEATADNVSQAAEQMKSTKSTPTKTSAMPN
ncbi:hypothetical protein V8J82_02830 [Gymnodinialimonas sp. 2305UL16-5]|uniref:hypothetical protein n=1 Tax=Gymnodinialimonas mytili TaxID=3126503 RepID=UPI0030B000A0